MEEMVRIIDGKFKGKIGNLIAITGQWNLVDIKSHKTEFFAEGEFEILSRSAKKRILKPKKNKQSSPRIWINVYEITREYGGPEEGGWYYNNWYCIKSISLPIWKGRKAYDKAQELEKIYVEEANGNIYSVLGGEEYQVCVETKEAQSETKERPYYC